MKPEILVNEHAQKLGQNAKTRSELGQKIRAEIIVAKHGKTHEDYWKARVRRRTFRNPDGTLTEVPEWQVKLYRDGRQLWLNLGTANKVDAARAARDQRPAPESQSADR